MKNIVGAMSTQVKEEDMGAIKLATSNNADEEYGGTYTDIKTKTIQGTTTESGAIQIYSNDDTLINKNKYVVLNIETSGTSNIFAFMRGDEYATCFFWNSDNWGGWSSGAVELKVTYAQRNEIS